MRRFYALRLGSQTKRGLKWPEKLEFGTFLQILRRRVCDSAFKRVFCARIRANFQTLVNGLDTVYAAWRRIRLSDGRTNDRLRPALEPHSTTFRSLRPHAPNLHFLSWGDAHNPVLILLHGGGSNAHWWDHIAPHFADQFYVLALDFRGHGRSDYPDDLVKGAFNDDLELLIDYLGCEDVVLIGHSMGSHVALEHASYHPETRALVLIDISRGAKRSTQRRSRLALRMRGTYASRESAIERFQFVPEARHAAETLRWHIASHSVLEEPTGRFSYRFDPRWFALGSRPAPDHTKISCPTLIIRGSESTILGEEAAQQFATEFPNGRCEVIQDAGHHVHIDRPEATRVVLQSFLSSLAR
jgi:esterase